MSNARIFPAQWQLATETLAAVLEQGRAADRLLQAGFKAQRNMGARDRQRVSALLYGTLRDLRRVQRIAGTADARSLCAVHALDAELSDVAGLQRLGVDDAEQLAARLAGFDDATLTAAERNNVPDAVWAQWQGAEWAQLLAAALCAQAPVDLRVNRLHAERAQVIAALTEAGIAAQPTPYAPLGVRLTGRVTLQNLPLYHDGWVEPQDEGSQLLAALVNAQPGEQIADWCAGAGGKTLALAAAMDGEGELWALDVDMARLKPLTPRLRRAGVAGVRTGTVDGELPADGFDAVLVDAPCSGTGTWRRQPEARLKPLDFDALAQTQQQILNAAAAQVRVGGRLVYGTCSVVAAENQAVVTAFLAAHPGFELVPARAVLDEQGIHVPDQAGDYLQLTPHQHGTDGFFGAVLRRTA